MREALAPPRPTGVTVGVRPVPAGLVALCAALLCAGPLDGQSPTPGHPLAGAWDVRWAQAVRVNTDGSVEIQRWGDAVLELVAEGDSLTGTWTTKVQETVTWRVGGRAADGTFRLTARENDSTDPELGIVEQIEWRGSLAEGDRLEGTVALSIRGRPRAPAERPFEATRRR